MSPTKPGHAAPVVVTSGGESYLDSPANPEATPIVLAPGGRASQPPDPGQGSRDTHSTPVDGSGADFLLLVYADTLDDLEKLRINLGNRHRALTSELIVGERGGSFGKGVDGDSPRLCIRRGF